MVLTRVGSASEMKMPSVVRSLGPGVVSPYTSTVDFYDFSSIIRYPYSGLAKRLDPLDPRRDPYMERMAGYFTVSAGDADYQVLYVPARSTSFSLFVRLWTLFGPPGRNGWRLADFDPLEKALSVVATLAIGALFALGSGRKRKGWPLVAFADSLLWLPSVLAGGPAALAFGLVNLCFSLPLVRSRYLAPGKRSPGSRRANALVRNYLVVTGISVIVFSLFQSDLSAVSLVVAPALCTLILAWLAPLARRFVDGRRKARVFSPVPILPSVTSRGEHSALPFALFALALVALAPLLRGGAYPAPAAVWGARNFSWNSMALLQKASRPDGLPDFSDFVAHEAYQQTMGIGGTWKEPVRGKRVYRQEYFVDPASGTVQARPQTIKALDRTWLASVVAERVPGSLESLLLAQGRPVAAGVRGPARALAGELPFTALAFAALLALLARDVGAGLLIRATLWRINGEARRDQIS